MNPPPPPPPRSSGGSNKSEVPLAVDRGGSIMVVSLDEGLELGGTPVFGEDDEDDADDDEIDDDVEDSLVLDTLLEENSLIVHLKSGREKIL